MINIDEILNHSLRLAELLVMANVKRNSPFLIQNVVDCFYHTYNLTQTEIHYQFISYTELSFERERTVGFITEVYVVSFLVLFCLFPSKLLWLNMPTS